MFKDRHLGGKPEKKKDSSSRKLSRGRSEKKRLLCKYIGQWEKGGRDSFRKKNGNL